MKHVFALENTVRHYDWGSVDDLPRLLSLPNPEGRPYAELWMGAHPEAPSRAFFDGREQTLDRMIAGAETEMLGEACAPRFSGRLPFLFKLLSAAKPLSIQAHPTEAQARAGWERENGLGVPLDAPHRNYKDPNHKPEILCALTPFEGLCGFRSLAEIRRLIALFDPPLPGPLRSALAGADEPHALGRLVEWTAGAPKAEREALAAFALSRARALAAEGGELGPLWRLIERLCRSSSGDASAVSPLFLNYIELAPGEAVFLPAGVLHAYLRGFGVELMANSNNVLRGGLTPKHVDTAELLRTLSFSSYRPEILRPAAADDSGFDEYPTPAQEFRLLALDAREREREARFPEGGPSLVVVVDGGFELRENGRVSERLERGQSAFIAAAAAAPTIAGRGLAYAAAVPR